MKFSLGMSNFLEEISGLSHLLCSSIYFHCQRRQWQPTPVLLPGESHWWRSLVGCSPWGREESDMSEWLNWTEPAIMLGDNKKQCVIKYWNCKTALSAIKEEKKESHHFVVDVRGRRNLNWVLRDRQDLKSWKKRKHYSRHHSRNRRQYEYLHVRWIWNVWRHSKEISLARGNEVEAYSSVQFSRSVMSGTRQGQKGKR